MSKQCNKNKKAHLFELGAEVPTTNNVGGITSIATGALGLADSIYTPFRDINNTDVNLLNPVEVSELNNFDSLQAFNKTLEPQQITFEDVGGHTSGQTWANIGKGAGAGASIGAGIGSFVGPVGTVIGTGIGAIAGGLITGATEIFGKNKAKRKQREQQNLADEKYNTQLKLVSNQANNINQNNLSDMLWNADSYYGALGGNLHSNSTTWDNGLNYIGAGGSHESNPNDGVAISTAPDGLQNKVEEGEVVWDNEYVFSKRLKVPESIKKKNKWKGSTFADVAKELMENSEERPNDPIALRGLDDSLSRLRDAQDELKAKQEERKLKKEIASMPPEMLAQLQQQAQQPTEEEIAQQVATEQQMPMVDSSMQQPMMQQPPLYAEGGHLFGPGGPSIKAISGAGYFKNPIAQRELTGLNLDNSGNISTTHKYQTPEEVATENQQNLLKYINRQTDYVNVRDAQRYGGLYNIEQINKNEYLNGSTPMDRKNRAEGIGNQQDWENKIAYYNRYPVQENIGLNNLVTSPKDIELNKNAYILDRNNPESVDFFKKKNPNLNLDSDTIYFYSKNNNDIKDKNKFSNANKISQEVYDKNNINNVIEMSGINFNKLKNYAKGGHLHGKNPYVWDDDISDAILAAENYLKHDNDIIAEAEYAKAIDSPIFRKTLSELIDNSESKTKTQTKKAKKEKERDWNFDQSKLRYVPAIGSTLGMLLSSRKPDYTNANEIARIGRGLSAQVSPKYIGDYLPYRPLDNTYYLNRLQAQQNATNNALTHLANGNRSMAAANLLASDYNYNNAIGDVIRQGEEYNNLQRQRVGEFNRGTNQFNAQQYMQAAAQNAQNRNASAAYLAEAAKMREQMDSDRINAISGNMTNMFNSIGDIGRDYMNNKMAGSVYDYRTDTSGNVWYNGKKYVPAAKGGYLTIKTKNRRKE